MTITIESEIAKLRRMTTGELANDADIRVTPPGKTAVDLTPIEQPDRLNTDQRLPSPGTAITRQYKGRTVQVVVLPDGFEYQGLRYKSLSAVARIITGSHCNGFRFFKLEATT